LSCSLYRRPSQGSSCCPPPPLRPRSSCLISTPSPWAVRHGSLREWTKGISALHSAWLHTSQVKSYIYIYIYIYKYMYMYIHIYTYMYVYISTPSPWADRHGSLRARIKGISARRFVWPRISQVNYTCIYIYIHTYILMYLYT